MRPFQQYRESLVNPPLPSPVLIGCHRVGGGGTFSFGFSPAWLFEGMNMDVPHLSHFPHGPIDAPTPHHLSDGTQTPKPNPLRSQALGVRCW